MPAPREARDVLAAATRVVVLAAGVVGHELIVAGTAEERVGAVGVVRGVRLVFRASCIDLALGRGAVLGGPLPALAEQRVVARIAVERIGAGGAGEEHVLFVSAAQDVVAVAAVDVRGHVDGKATRTGRGLGELHGVVAVVHPGGDVAEHVLRLAGDCGGALGRAARACEEGVARRRLHTEDVALLDDLDVVGAGGSSHDEPDVSRLRHVERDEDLPVGAGRQRRSARRAVALVVAEAADEPDVPPARNEPVGVWRAHHHLDVVERLVAAVAVRAAVVRIPPGASCTDSRSRPAFRRTGSAACPRRRPDRAASPSRTRRCRGRGRR